ncbi:hypothetical protein PPACK8108_LOCUS19522 [Phakopsora pachyrhizi]|uniref:G-patch domain-containing protein n=1 Tax=Phakopsora pachyrhizi TaxID=170000 RepID=A0AAV0BE18_PHAPC|nr:hypothetical protein PPACK8108_LOCUS19522 [Phakopsora pachyrhizi]
MVLDPKEYLTSQGWKGPGSGFKKNSRSKPIISIQKRNRFGIGKDRDECNAWWDDVYSVVAKKISEKSVKKRNMISEEIEENQPDDSKRLKKRKKINKDKQSIEERSEDLTTTIERSRINIIRNQLYRKFLRGSMIEGTINDDKIEESKYLVKSNNSTDIDNMNIKRGADEDYSSKNNDHQADGLVSESSTERKKDKKDKRSKNSHDDELNSVAFYIKYLYVYIN